MNPFSPIHPMVGGLAAAAIVCSASAFAQEDLGTLVNSGLKAMEAGQWEEALKLHTEAVDRFGKNQPLTLFGPRFGVIYYRKGIAEMKLGQWEAAMKSFENCYREFPNAGEVAGGGNIFHKMALLKWGEAAMGAEQWELAISQFKKFLEERDRTRDQYPQGAFHINMAICHYNLGKIPEGNEQLEIAIANKDRFPTPESGIMAAFQTLVSSAISRNNEQALLDFIGKNRGEITLQPFRMHRYSNVFMKLAADAIGAEMPRAAFTLYQLVPSTQVAADDLRARIKALGKATTLRDGSAVYSAQELAADLSSLESTLSGNKAPEVTKLAAIAFIHEKNGNVRGASAAYLQLEAFYPKAERREDNLYNLVRTQSILGEIVGTQTNATKFLRDFPDSPYVPTVRRLMLSSLFYDGKYEACIEVAQPMIKTLQEGTPEHDLCLHVLGGSYFYTGRYDDAQPLLDEHVTKYPESDFALPALYFQASNESRRQYWAKSGQMLDAFMAKFPDAAENVFLPFALYDRANAHYAEDQNDGALEKVARIISEFPDSKVADQAYNLRGNIKQAAGENDAARQAYERALEIAERRANSVVAGEALYYLVALIGEKKANDSDPEALKAAVPFADKYWEEYAAGSPFQAQVAVAQVHAMDAAGRGEEALARLRDVIAEMAKDPEAMGLEQAINSYTSVYLEKHEPEELKEHYYNFPGVSSTDRAARALLRIAIIGVFEEVAKDTQDEARRRSAQAMIQVLFRELRTDFALKDLTNYILVKLGDYVRNNTSNPAEALPFYDEALARQDLSYRFAALLGRADVYGQSAIAAEVDKGIADFERIYADSQDRNEREFSLYRIIQLRMATGEYAEAADKARVYLDREKSGFSKFSAEVGLMLAQSFDSRSQPEDAIAMYMKVWSAHMGNIRVSSVAMKRWMELSWQRNKPGSEQVKSDRQGAYDGGASYLSLTGRFKDKMTPEELALWTEVEELAATYLADPAVKSQEQQQRERAGR
jgi:tetratricopeptide (TPR) repeat protein